jgi:peptidoglycan/xylan/chitin deacetylase (PgdA/CDA1 family)
MKKISIPLAIVIATSLFACNQVEKSKAQVKSATVESTGPENTIEETPKSAEAASKNKVMANAATILGRKEVPVLCYHQIRDWTASDSKGAKDYIRPIAAFKADLKLLADSGYHTVLPDQVYDYLAYGSPLPSKPVMLTYDDTDDDQFTIAAPEMKKYGFKGVFFIMTVSINRPKYMTTAQIKQLSDEGHVVTSHTWDHHSVKGYKTEQDWATQIEKPKKKIEEITGKPAIDFAYPFGLWKHEAIPELKKRGVRSAYILSTKRDQEFPLYTIRRIIASGYWSAPSLHKNMLESFH